jgi:hypothetical protein
MTTMRIECPCNELTASLDDGPVGVNVTYFRNGEAIYSNVYERPFHCVLDMVYDLIHKMHADNHPAINLELTFESV